MPRKGTHVRSPSQQIAALNDRMRKNPSANGEVLVSEGIVALGEAAKAKAFKVIASLKHGDFDGFDPYGERSFNTFWLGEQLAYFRIGYYTKDDLRVHAEDPSDPANTTRVMTVSLWSEEGQRP